MRQLCRSLPFVADALFRPLTVNGRGKPLVLTSFMSTTMELIDESPFDQTCGFGPSKDRARGPCISRTNRWKHSSRRRARQQRRGSQDTRQVLLLLWQVPPGKDHL